jgi:hypothetical protein
MIDIVLFGFFFWVFNALASWIIFMHYSSKLFSYLKNNYYSKWRSMALIADFGFGIGNIFKTLPYYFNKEDTNDKKIFLLKKKAVSWFKYSILSFIFLILWLIIAPIIISRLF